LRPLHFNLRATIASSVLSIFNCNDDNVDVSNSDEIGLFYLPRQTFNYLIEGHWTSF
jgi:hypothetical protein